MPHMVNRVKGLEIIDRVIGEADGLINASVTDVTFVHWKQVTISTLQNVFGYASNHEQAITRVQMVPLSAQYVSSSSPKPTAQEWAGAYLHGLKTMIAILQAARQEIVDFFPEHSVGVDAYLNARKALAASDPLNVSSPMPVQRVVQKSGTVENIVRSQPVSDVMQLIRAVDEIRALIEDAATYNSNPDQIRYAELRLKLLAEPRLQPYLPTLVQSRSALSGVRNLAQSKGGYAERREFVASEFTAVDQYLRGQLSNPAATAATDVLSRVDCQHVVKACQKAMDRVASDPDGAITSARTLLESVCKHILAEQHAQLTGKEDLPTLYHSVVKGMGLAPDKNSEPALRQIMQGCSSIVQGVGELRSKIGDAHGLAPEAAIAERRHATLSVSVACAVAAFLIETWEAPRDHTNG